LKYSYEDENGIVDHIEQLANNNCILYFKPDVVSKATGATKNSRLSVKLYALFEWNTAKAKQEITISIQDAACGCPAKTGSSTWVMLDCHNCGADETKNPQTAAYAELRGAYFMWGYGVVPWRDRNQNQWSSSSYVGPVVGGKTKSFPDAIIWNNYYPFDNAYPASWEVPFQPCKPGWKMGNETVWRSIESNNRWVSNNRSRIIDIGKYVDLPKQGYYHSLDIYIRANGTYDAAYVGDRYDYWTSTSSSAAYGKNFYGVDINSANVSVDTWGDIVKYYAEPVRCVQEGSTYVGSSAANNP
jgi:hypothetical protein